MFSFKFTWVAILNDFPYFSLDLSEFPIRKRFICVFFNHSAVGTMDPKHHILCEYIKLCLQNRCAQCIKKPDSPKLLKAWTKQLRTSDEVFMNIHNVRSVKESSKHLVQKYSLVGVIARFAILFEVQRRRLCHKVVGNQIGFLVYQQSIHVRMYVAICRTASECFPRLHCLCSEKLGKCVFLPVACTGARSKFSSVNQQNRSKRTH